MKVILPRIAILIGTRPGREEQLNNCLKSLEGLTIPVIVSDVDGYEIGKFKDLLDKTSIDEFIFLQDSIEIKDQNILNLCFGNRNSVSLNNYPQEFGCYMGKFKRSVLEQMNLPDIKTKEDSVNYEEKIYFDYKKYDKVDHIGGDLNNVNNFVEKFGHKVMKLENEYLIKYKSVWNRNMI